jgi:hypothetical protein
VPALDHPSFEWGTTDHRAFYDSGTSSVGSLALRIVEYRSFGVKLALMKPMTTSSLGRSDNTAVKSHGEEAAPYGKGREGFV